LIKVTHFKEVTRFDTARTLLGRGWYWSTAYLVDGLMVDTGCAHAAWELMASLDEHLPNSIVNTHGHEDHIGANHLLQERFPGMRVLAHPLALPVLEDPRREQHLQFYRRTLWGYPLPSQGQPAQDRAVIETGKFLFQVIYTPGHSPDHLCLYEPDRGWLFTGDLFVGGRDRALGHEYDIWQIIASLKAVSKLCINTMFPGSARVRENPNLELVEKIAYLEELGSRILQLNARGWSLPAITRAVCGPPILIEFITWGHFSRRNLVSSYLKKITH
jgi:glyoxylase-like metal-dependent hydrolase (beta-lactamase superfamily II)